MNNLEGKTRFWQQQSQDIDLVGPIKQLLMRSGKLTRLGKDQDWRNVVEHSLVVSAVTDTLSEMLDLSDQEHRIMRRAAIVHDWDKRIEKFPGDFKPSDIEAANLSLLNISPDHTIVTATKENFYTRSSVSFFERLMFYADEMVNESSIMTPKERIEKTKKRNFNGTNWDLELALAQDVEQEIFQLLDQDLQTKIGEPSNIPHYIRTSIESRYLNT